MSFDTQFKKGCIPHNRGKGIHSSFCPICNNPYERKTIKLCLVCKTKRCRKCNKIKPLIEFYKDKTTTSGFDARCKSCRQKQKKKSKESQKRQNIKKYGLTLEEFTAMLEKQKGVCAICGNPEIKRMLSIDHNHKTGYVRGLLCTACNFKLGVIENKEFINKAHKYIEKAGKLR